MASLPVRYVYFIMRTVIKKKTNHPVYNARYVGKNEKTGKTDQLCSPWIALKAPAYATHFLVK